MLDLWYPKATRFPGPEWKYGYGEPRRHPKTGFLGHSVEGPASSAIAVIQGPASVSFPLLIWKDGAVWQFYPADYDCWHAGDVDDDGGVAANIDLVGVEHAGRAGEPLTEAQFQSSLSVYKWLAEVFNWGPPVLYDPSGGPEAWARATMFEHGQVADRYTACPSDRIPHVRYIKEVNALTEQEKLELYVRRIMAAAMKALADNRPSEVANILKVYLGVVAK